ncbi:MAG: protein kinase [Anaerolineae bacterium]|nr:protein kinase [Anaerolineae bacterium]
MQDIFGVLPGAGVLLLFLIVVTVWIIRRRCNRSPLTCPGCGCGVTESVACCPRCGATLQPVSAAQKPVPVATLAGLEGLLKGKLFTITVPGNLSLGRDPGNDVALTGDALVSRQHAQIVTEDGQCVLYDRNSVNGIFVNNQRVLRHVLQSGDVIQICNSAFRFTGEGTPPPLPASQPHASLPDSMRLSDQAHFEGYILEKKVGQGGMSVVYKASDAHGMPVAIKVLDVTDEYIVRKFIQEGEIGAALRDHPNICRVFTSGQAQDNRFYLVMEYIEGRSLRALVGKPLTDAQIVLIIGQVCDALHYAHLCHIVHRDIKPENILLEDSGLVKVADFGIAKLTSSVTVTQNRLMGTPEYVSPEQARAQRILPSSDIYSVGVVLYELLAGHPPFPLPDRIDSLTRERVAFNMVLSAHINKKPLPPSQIRPGVSRRLEQIALKALEKEPSRRFESAWEMAQALGFQRQIAPPPMPVPLAARLVITQGRTPGKIIRLEGPNVVLGRAQIAPEDGYISQHHVNITPHGNQFWLEDLSRNGTWVNGQRVYGEVSLKVGDEICVGSQVLRLEM